MQGLSFKIGEREDWRCGICCHVRTATILLGVWHLMLHLLTLSVVGVVIRHPELMNQQITQGTTFVAPGVDQQTLPTVSTPEALPDQNEVNVMSGDQTYPIYSRSNYEYQHLNFRAVVMLMTFAITLLMVYGAIKGKPSYLMPFFCLQVIDFCIASLTALSSLCYLSDMHRMIADSPKIPMRAYLLSLSPQLLAFVVLVTFSASMVVKAYLIGVVWSCYKYLTFRLIAVTRTANMIPESPPVDLQDLLPDYETACSKFPHPSPPPPSYSQAVLSVPQPAAPPAASHQPPPCV